MATKDDIEDEASKATNDTEIETNKFTNVFVYGTLKKGEPNHHWITDETKGKSRFVCVAETLRHYPLVIATKYNIPFLLHVPGQGEKVIGEVYEIDEGMLQHLDVLEDYPSFYQREIDVMKVVSSDQEGVNEGDRINCWIYLLKGFKPELLNLPHLREYSSEGEHGLKFCERYTRDSSDSYYGEVLCL